MSAAVRISPDDRMDWIWTSDRKFPSKLLQSTVIELDAEKQTSIDILHSV